MEKSSAVRAFNNGITSGQIIDSLNRLSDKKVPDALVWNLKDWEKRYGEVSVKKCLVLTLAEDKQYLTKTMPLSGLIAETLAPGIYLLNEETEEQAVTVLNNTGIDIIARKKYDNKTIKREKTIQSPNYFPALSDLSVDNKIKRIPVKVSGKGIVSDIKTSDTNTIGDIKTSPISQTNEQSSGLIIQNLHDMLKNIQIEKNCRDELAARINRRLILCETQLKNANIRYEKLEARHMDYTGKHNIAKQAITQGSPVEVVYPAGKSEKQVFGIPKVLEKKGNELILVINPVGKDTEIHIPLAKISLLRRIKKSIFEE